MWGTLQFDAIGTANIWWYNISGGTDLFGSFCTGNRELPQIPGEMPSLGQVFVCCGLNNRGGGVHSGQGPRPRT